MPPDKAEGRPPGRPDNRPKSAPASASDQPSAGTSSALSVTRRPDSTRELAGGQLQAYQERQRRYAAETAAHERGSRRDLEELFDRRNDGVAADRRFREHLAWHAVVFGDGTVRTSPALILSELTQAERRLQRTRGDAG